MSANTIKHNAGETSFNNVIVNIRPGRHTIFLLLWIERKKTVKHAYSPIFADPLHCKTLLLLSGPSVRQSELRELQAQECNKKKQRREKTAEGINWTEWKKVLKTKQKNNPHSKTCAGKTCPNMNFK